MKSIPENQPDKLLFTPGPLTTSLTVKQAMLHDAGSWHHDFNERVRWIREKLLALAELSSADGWVVVPLQGSGTYGVESVFATCIPADGKVCVLANGAYGERMVLMLEHLKIPHLVLRSDESETPDLVLLEQALTNDSSITHVAAVHCETTTGILNPIHAIGDIVKRHCCLFIVDAMSSFGGMAINIESSGIDFLISSSNKCLESVPGFCFVIARRDDLTANKTQPRSLSLNLVEQLLGFEKNGQFRYTPPTHTLLAFEQAIKELQLEGGVTARTERYQSNHALLIRGMMQLGFRPYLSPNVQSHIITAFHYPTDPRFLFSDFYLSLSAKGFIIYPGKISRADTFRIGNIGHLFESDIHRLLIAVGEAISESGIEMKGTPSILDNYCVTAAAKA
jgi:2-aminoethylphosphonate-pyruvate transaminase